MSDSGEKRPVSYVKLLRDIRDRHSKELENLTLDERLRWHKEKIQRSPWAMEILSRIKPRKVSSRKVRKARAGVRARLAPYPAYKPSGVEGLVEVPEHWEVQVLKRVATITMGQSPPGDAVHTTSFGLPFLQGCAEFGVLHPTPTHYCSNPPKSARAHAMLLSVRAPVGSINIADQDYGIGRGLCAINPGTGWHDRFAYWQLQVLHHDLQLLATGSTYDAVSIGDIASLRLALPTPWEQRVIAKYLDRETAKIDALIGRKEALVKRLKEYRTALVSRTVTRGLPPAEAQKAGLDPHPKLKPSGVEWLGEVPEHWRMVPLKRHCRIVNGGTPSSTEPKYWGGSVRWITPEDLGGIDERMISETRRTLTRLGLAKSGAELVPDSSVVLSTRAPIGHVAVTTGPSSTNQGCRSLVPMTSVVDPTFLYYTMYSQRATLQSLGRGTTFAELSAVEVGQFLLLLPLRSEQRVIGECLDRETAKIDRATHLAHEEIKLLREYRARLISDVVTGKVDVRGFLGANVKAVA